MPDTVECPGCRRAYDVPAAHRGRAVRCKQCGTAFTLSATDTVNAPSSPALATLVAQAVVEGSAQPGVSDRPAASESPAASSKPSPATGGAKSDPAGRAIGRFRLGVRLGQGAFGAVYRAFDTVLQREVALKLPLARTLESPEARARLEREPKAAAQLHHPHIVPVYDAGFVGDQFFIASAFIEGRTLDAALGGSSMNPVRAALIVEKLAEALDYAHRLGIVHRDVKPSNVMLDAQDEPHLFDFGLAHWQTPEDENLTTDGSLMGTPAYMSPEQAGAPVGDVGPASDEYALGVILYELLCGKRPFDGPPLTVMYQIREQEPERLGRRAPHVPRDLEAVCHKALEKRPQARYALCGELAADLRRWRRGETVRARRPGPIERARRWASRHRALAATFALAVLLAVASTISAVGFRTFYNRAADHAQRAETALADLQRETEARRTTEGKLQDRETKVAEQEKLLTTRAEELKQRDAALSAKDQTLATRDAELKKLSADLAKGQTELDQSKKLLATREQELAGAISARDAAVSQAPWLAYVGHLQKAQAFLVDGKTQEAQAELDACDEKTRDTEWRLLKAVADGGLYRWKMDRPRSTAGKSYVGLQNVLMSPNGDSIFVKYQTHDQFDQHSYFVIVDSVTGEVQKDGYLGVTTRFDNLSINQFDYTGDRFMAKSATGLMLLSWGAGQWSTMDIPVSVFQNANAKEFAAATFVSGGEQIVACSNTGSSGTIRIHSNTGRKVDGYSRCHEFRNPVWQLWPLGDKNDRIIGDNQIIQIAAEQNYSGARTVLPDDVSSYSFNGRVAHVRRVAIHPAKRVFVAGSGNVYSFGESYDRDDGRDAIVSVVAPKCRPIAFNEDGTRLLGVDEVDKRVLVFDAASDSAQWPIVLRLDPKLFPVYSYCDGVNGMMNTVAVSDDGALVGWGIRPPGRVARTE